MMGGGGGGAAGTGQGGSRAAGGIELQGRGKRGTGRKKVILVILFPMSLSKKN